MGAPVGGDARLLRILEPCMKLTKVTLNHMGDGSVTSERRSQTKEQQHFHPTASR